MPDAAWRRLALRTVLAAFPGTAVPDWACRLLDDGLAGYVLFASNIDTPEQVGQLARRLREVRGDVIVGTDEEAGDVTRLAHAEGSPYPGNAALGVVDDPELTRRVHAGIGRELHQLGIRLNLAPVVDINTSDENPIIGTRSFGTDPKLVARHAAAAVAGLADAGVAACAKHFPGHGATVTDSHLETPVVAASPDLLRERELVPFAAAIEAGVPALMTAHIRVPALTGELPATLSERVLTDLLRGELGFTGTVVTDALEMRGVSAGIGIGEAAVRALAAGADLLCLGAEIDAPLVEATATAIVTAVRDGRLPVERLEQAADRAARLARPPEPASPPADETPSGAEVARRALRIEGTPPGLAGSLLVYLDSPATIAAGEVPWHLAPVGVEVTEIRVSPGPDTDPDALLARADGDPIVVVSRDTHRHPHARRVVERLAAGHPDVVLVEMGWPSRWRPKGLRAYLATYGSGRPNATAAAAALLAGP